MEPLNLFDIGVVDDLLNIVLSRHFFELPFPCFSHQVTVNFLDSSFLVYFFDYVAGKDKILAWWNRDTYSDCLSSVG